MQVFDQPSFHEHDALARGGRFAVRRDDPPRPLDLLGRRGECCVRGSDLLRVDQRLAVEAELAALPACGRQALIVGEVEVNAIENRQSVGAGGQYGEAEGGNQWQTIMSRERVQLFGQVRGAENERGKPGLAAAISRA